MEGSDLEAGLGDERQDELLFARQIEGAEAEVGLAEQPFATQPLRRVEPQTQTGAVQLVFSTATGQQKQTKTTPSTVNLGDARRRRRRVFPPVKPWTRKRRRRTGFDAAEDDRLHEVDGAVGDGADFGAVALLAVGQQQQPQLDGRVARRRRHAAHLP